MAIGDTNRSTAATNMNSNSSRSHAILQLAVTVFNRISQVGTIFHGRSLVFTNEFTGFFCIVLCSHGRQWH